MAAPRIGGSYAIPAESIDAGGQHSEAGGYVHDGTLGGIGGTAVSAGAPEITAKQGFAGQLYEARTLELLATPPTLGEGATLQIFANLWLDDASRLVLEPSAVAWSIEGGPLANINAQGIATAGRVFATTQAVVRGTYQSLSVTLQLTVSNASPDDFGLYAGDGIDDDWQVQFFGENNPAAAPEKDPDGDTQDNRFEFLAGLDPADGTSSFKVRLEQLPGEPERHGIVFGPLAQGRTYSVMQSFDLGPANWHPLAGTVQNNGSERSVTHDSSGQRSFYKVEISRP